MIELKNTPLPWSLYETEYLPPENYYKSYEKERGLVILDANKNNVFSIMGNEAAKKYEETFRLVVDAVNSYEPIITADMTNDARHLYDDNLEDTLENNFKYFKLCIARAWDAVYGWRYAGRKSDIIWWLGQAENSMVYMLEKFFLPLVAIKPEFLRDLKELHNALGSVITDAARPSYSKQLEGLQTNISNLRMATEIFYKLYVKEADEQSDNSDDDPDMSGIITWSWV